MTKENTIIQMKHYLKLAEDPSFLRWEDTSNYHILKENGKKGVLNLLANEKKRMKPYGLAELFAEDIERIFPKPKVKKEVKKDAKKS